MKRPLLFLAALAIPATALALTNDDPKPCRYDPVPGIRSEYPEEEPNNACPGQQILCGDVVTPAELNPAGDVDYYEFVVAAGTQVTIGTDALVPGGPDVDTYVELYGSDCSQARLTYSDDDGPGAFSLISNFIVPVTGPYHIKVRGWSSSTTGAYKLFLTCSVPPPPPGNDQCSGAFELARCGNHLINGDNSNATNDYDPTASGCTGYAAAGKDVAYLFNLLAGDVLNVSYAAVADGSVYLLTNCADPLGSCVIGADDTFAGQAETFSYTVPAAGPYYLIADSYGTNTGTTYVLEISITCGFETGACCFYGTGPCGPEFNGCLELDFASCQQQGGEYSGDGTVCDPLPCPAPPPTGACCLPGGDCLCVTQGDCDAMSGVYQGDGTTCEGVACAPVAIERSTWGRVKTRYR
ncbi:MAG: PPC domain-containing protein [Candidatus Eisenbacteria bacterium]